MYSESQDTYPLISFAYLKDFCKKVNLLPEDQLNVELPPEEDEKPESTSDEPQ